MDKDILAEAKEVFEEAVECEGDNRARMLEDVRFVHLNEQWPELTKVSREAEHRPCLTINKLSAFLRQVVNDARMNRPQIDVTPVDSQADPETAEILSGLVRHIERNSSADVAYDTAVEWAVSGGLGYFAIGTEYADETSFNQEIRINRVVSPFSIYGDPNGEAADSSDWRTAFQIITGEPSRLEKQYGVKAIANWGPGTVGDVSDDDDARLARYWKIDEKAHTLVMLSNGGAINEDELTDELRALAAAEGIYPVEGRTRRVLVPRVKMYILSDAEVLESVDWPGKYIPIVPVYGSEIWIDGERVLKSMIHDAKDAQRMFNYWRTQATELVALAPKAPFVGPKNAFVTDATKWASANTENHPYLRYDGDVPPQRQPFAGVPAGALQEALNSSDDIKAITGMFDASLGARSNETSGRAIQMRQREGDVGTFHFIDNLTRAIRHAGRILVDLIPKIYDTPRVVRILGKDGEAEQVQINSPTPQLDDNGQPMVDEQGQAIERIYDTTTGTYDVSVQAGPSFTTQRQEAAAQMTEMIRAFPAAAPVIGDLIAKNLDWPGADEMAKRLEKLAQGPQADPAEAQAAQAEAAANAQIAQADQAMKAMDLEMKRADVRIKELEVEAKKIDAQARVATAQIGARSQFMQAVSPPAQLPTT